MSRPRPQEIYRHFKGRYYMVLTLAQKEDTGEILVIYQAMYGSFQVYARALSSFTEELDPIKYPSAGQKYRFELVSEGELRSRQADAEAGISMQAQTPIRTAKGSMERSGAERTSQITGTSDRSSGEIRRNFAGKVPLRSDQPEQRTAVKSFEAATAAESSTAANTNAAESVTDGMSGQQADDEITVDPLVEEFLDAQRATQRLDILRRLHSRITDEMIDMMALSAGFEVEEGDIEERYQDLRYCLLTIDKYEQRRDRFRNNE